MRPRRKEPTKQFAFVLPIAMGERIHTQAKELKVYPATVLEWRLARDLRNHPGLPQKPDAA